jgi:hypothetical protein
MRLQYDGRVLETYYCFWDFLTPCWDMSQDSDQDRMKSYDLKLPNISLGGSAPLLLSLEGHNFLIEFHFHCLNVNCHLTSAHHLWIRSVGVHVTIEQSVDLLKRLALRLHPVVHLKWLTLKKR